MPDTSPVSPARQLARLTLRYPHRFVAQAARRRTLARHQRRLEATLRTTPPPYRVHVGASGKHLPGWLDTDIATGAPFYLDMTRPWPTPPGSVSHVYGDMVIQDLPMPLARQAFRHVYRALASGGRLRLATPDIERICHIYVAEPELAQAHLERDLRHGYEAYYPADIVRLTYQAAGGTNNFLWDFAALAAELQAAGFVDVRRYAAGESDDPALRGLESRMAPTEVATTLAVEAMRP